MAVSDRVTVLRNGRLVETVKTADATPQSLTTLMVGHQLHAVTRTPRATAAEETVLDVNELSVDGDRGLPAVHGLSLRVGAGEIVAIAGVAGNGQRELAETIAGVRPHTSGAVRVLGKPLRNGDGRRSTPESATSPRTGSGRACPRASP
jgi:simple sugar transport system ATP-binding protein